VRGYLSTCKKANQITGKIARRCKFCFFDLLASLEHMVKKYIGKNTYFLKEQRE
jgi:hypothetical protein